MPAINKSAASALLSALGTAIGLTLLLPSCSKSESPSGPSVIASDTTGPVLDVNDFRQGESRLTPLSNGSKIQVQRRGDKLLYRLEGTFTRETFAQIRQNIAFKPDAEKKLILQQEIDNVFESAVKIGAISQTSIPEIGYFSMFMPYEPELMHAVKALHIVNQKQNELHGNPERSILVSPIVTHSMELADIRMVSRSVNQEIGADLRTERAALSGLERIGAVEFVKQAEKDIGGNVHVNGSSVQVGVADTGITYNHPTFRSRTTDRVRINHIQDVTGEGAVYISPAAKFSVTPSTSDPSELSIEAEIISTPKLPSFPAADDLTVYKAKIKVSEELRALLTAPQASGAKLGVIFEENLGSSEDKVDLNANGKMNDELLVLYFPARDKSPERVFFDPSATGDFRKSKALTEFNDSFDTQDVFAEKIGFSFRDAKLTDKAGKKAVSVRSISFVGYDPGNHGSHVSGIIAGQKTIANDSDDTLARGVAPEASIAVTRICPNNSGCSSVAGLADLVVNAKAEVVNMSIAGLDEYNDEVGIGETLINRMVSTNNTAFIIAAGNSGPGKQTVGRPSVARLALSIGASATYSLISRQYTWPASVASEHMDDDFMLFFSGRGPTASGGFKPNLAAPGTELSSIQLNTAPGQLGGVEVYWGTSMASPTAAGAYALLLDAIKKYNERHSSSPLPTDAMVLRRILIESARPFDAHRLEVGSGLYTQGQYTWADEGAGMINLPGAWKKVFEYRDMNPPSAVSLDGKPVELDYDILTSQVAANGLPYDGSRQVRNSGVFGAGLYLKSSDRSTIKSVSIRRFLPESLAGSESAGELTRQLRSTADRFELKTVMYGSNQVWLKPGVQDSADCAASESSDLTLYSDGAAIENDESSSSIVGYSAGTLRICLDQAKISQLAPGDHGALIYAYRKVGARVSPVASFIVPVYLNVPHQTLVNSAALDHSGTIASFGVDRHYVLVPKGTSVLKITLSVPEIKLTPQGAIAPGETCSGVELMGYAGVNTVKAVGSREKSQVQNCDSKNAMSSGAPTNLKADRELVIMKSDPRPGLWDLHVFGQYRFATSKYRLRVDYITGTASTKSIEGDPSVLNGKLTWSLKESSIGVSPSAKESAYTLSALRSDTKSSISQDQKVYVASPLGVLRSYPEGVKSVRVETSDSSGNDIDLYARACPSDVKDPADSRCEVVDSSTGSSDEEIVYFEPKPDMRYAILVTGESVDGEAKFLSSEFLNTESETGSIEAKSPEAKESGMVFEIGYAFATEASKLLKNPLFTSGSYDLEGVISLKSEEGALLVNIPVRASSAKR